MPYLQSASTLNGYKLTEIKSCSDQTEAVVLKDKTFKKYVSVDSPFRKSDWEKIKSNIFMELGLINASS